MRVEIFGVRGEGLGVRVWRLRVGDWSLGSGFGNECSELRVWGLGFIDKGSGFRFRGSGPRF